MTISRKEFVRYEGSLANIGFLASELRRTPWWRPGTKTELLADIQTECVTMSDTLACRISKPRPRKQGNAIGALPSDGDHDA